ncbi:hypothetical protein ZWY2020_036619 [Hordeum vulgare]|nr:hypothetical protein ZWY2020_036619 [Hordeum vulgare]
MGHGLLLPTPPHAAQAQRQRCQCHHATPRNGVLPPSLVQARSTDHFTFQSPQPRSVAPDRGNRFYPQFLAPPRQAVPAQFPGGPAPTASGVLNASSSQSTRAQSVFLLSSGRRDALAREAATGIMQRREPPTRRVGGAFLAQLAGTGSVQRGFDGGLLHERPLLVGTAGSAQRAMGFGDARLLHGQSLLARIRAALREEMMRFDDDVDGLHRRTLLAGTGFAPRTEPIGFFYVGLHTRTLLAGPGYVSRRQSTGLGAGTAQMMESSGDDNRAAAAAAATRNEAILWRRNRMVRIQGDATRARADILAASRGRGGRGGGSRAPPDGWN